MTTTKRSIGPAAGSFTLDEVQRLLGQLNLSLSCMRQQSERRCALALVVEDGVRKLHEEYDDPTTNVLANMLVEECSDIAGLQEAEAVCSRLEAIFPDNLQEGAAA